MAKEKVRLVIFGDPNRPNASEAVEDFLKFASTRAEIIANCFKGDPTRDVVNNADFAVVFGGDGTILSVARELSETNIPVIGVNVGKLGFLAEFSLQELKNFFHQIEAGNLLIEKRMILSCRITRHNKELFTSTAINDLVINAGPPFNMIELQMTVNGQKLAGCISDGLIISTPTGSTAYNLSLGGPILSGNLSALVITPMSPHSLSFRPIVISAERTIEVTPIRVNQGTAVILDGVAVHQLKAEDTITISRHKGAFLIVNNPIRTQWDTLATKLNWAGKPKYNSSGDEKL